MNWLPIKMAPENKPIIATDGNVIVVLELDKVDAIPYPVGFDGHEWEWDFKQEDLTHWMPLPDLP